MVGDRRVHARAGGDAAAAPPSSRSSAVAKRALFERGLTPSPAAAMNGVRPVAFGKSTIAPCCEQQLDRLDVRRVRGAQQRRRARREAVVGAALADRVAELGPPQLELRVRIRAALEQLLDQRRARRTTARPGRSGDEIVFMSMAA